MNIVIADDSIVMRKALKIFFTGLGHTVVAEVGDGDQAIRNYSIYKPDLLTLDLSMPGSNGMVALKKIIEKDKDAKIIIVSSDSKKSTIVEALQLGAKYYILKPFNFDKIQHALEKVFVKNITQEDVELELESELSESDKNKSEVNPFDNIETKVFIIVKHDFSGEYLSFFKDMKTCAACMHPSEITFDFRQTTVCKDKKYIDIKKGIENELGKGQIKIICIP